MTLPDSHHPLLHSVAHFLQPAVVSCLILKSQVSGTRDFSCCGVFGTFLGPHLYSKKGECAIAGIMLSFVNRIDKI